MSVEQITHQCETEIVTQNESEGETIFKMVKRKNYSK